MADYPKYPSPEVRSMRAEVAKARQRKGTAEAGTARHQARTPRPWSVGVQQQRRREEEKQARQALLEQATLCRLKVVVRVRPWDAARDASRAVVVSEPRVGPWLCVQGGPKLKFSTAVLGPLATQRDAFVECALPLIELLQRGQHAALFAFGQTGSGKTFSLLGDEGGR